jgi:hypothetical protein
MLVLDTFKENTFTTSGWTLSLTEEIDYSNSYYPLETSTTYTASNTYNTSYPSYNILTFILTVPRAANHDE